MAEKISKKLSEKLSDEIWNVVSGKGEEIVAAFVKNRLDERELKKAIQAYLDEFCEKKLSHLSLDEEFDFEGFTQFLFSRHERLEEYFYSEIGTRGAVLAVLQGEALAYAKPTRQSGRRMVLGCLDAVLATIENVLLERVEPEDLFLASRTGEQLRQAVEKIVTEQAKRLHGHIDYRGSFAELVDNVETELPDDDRAYHYRNSKIGFFGREKELNYLDAFLEDDAPFLYTVITGPGGIGKSKLLYQYVHINENDPDWKMLYPSGDVVQALCEHRGEFFYPKGLLVVVDYVGQYPEKIGKWMAEIIGNKRKPQKMRMILLERPSPEQDVKPEWYKKLVNQRKGLENFLWEKWFYAMELMRKESLFALMDNIAGQEHKTLTEQNKQDIYERVCSFHHEVEGGSPLYTILTTDAFLNDIPLTSLDTNKLMTYVLERDEMYWENTICSGDQELYRCFKEMLIYATAVGGWDFTPVGEPLTEEAECLRKISRQGKSAIWAKFSQIVAKNAEGNPILKPLEPDLIGEYFVLNFLRDQVADERYWGRIELFWKKLWPYAYFLDRCVDSYLSQQAFQELLDDKKSVFWLRNENWLAAYLSARLMVNLITKQDAIARTKSVGQLRKLSEDQYTGSTEIALEYAKGLFNLSNKQELPGRKASMERLGALSEKYDEIEEIALVYAKGLANLTGMQDVVAGTESVKYLGVLSAQHDRNAEIALVYAKVLVYLILEQDAIAGTESVEQLRKLSKERNDGNAEIALEYAEGLFNLSNKQELFDCKESVVLLGALSEKYDGNVKIACVYAKGLFNLSTKQERTDRKVSVKRLSTLSARYAGNEEIALMYAKGLLNLSNKQELSGRKASVKCLNALSTQHAGNEEIVLVYAKGLFNLSMKQDLPSRKASVERLGRVSAQYAGNEEIALVYAKGLTLLCVEGNSVDIVIQELQRFYANWQADPAAVKQAVSNEPDSNMKTLKRFLLEHTALFPQFME